VQRTASAAILERLVEAAVVEEAGDRVVLTEEFQAEYERQTTTGDRGVRSAHTSENGGDAATVGSYEAALDAFEVDLDADERAAAAESLADIAETSSEIVTVEGEDLAALLERTRYVLVLVYKDGCEPCQRVRAKLDRLDEAGTIPDDVVIARVLGTECQRLLWDEYDVVGAPTLLFAREGGIEMRLTGNVHVEQLRSDIRRLYA